nr:integrase, catalytic region, zinc finger, CCHC-type, peptidase aspartic, catalytic [Tanacetum cinerariifolium]
VRLKVLVRRIRTDNGTEFVNQTLRDYYEEVGISHETSVALSSQQNGVVERQAVATACFTQNRSIIHLRHGKTPYELLHSKQPDLSFFHVFGALCYPTNNSENLGKLKPKAVLALLFSEADVIHHVERSSESETHDFASCVSSPMPADSFFTVDVKILQKSDVKDPSPTNGVSSCSIKKSVKPPSDLCNKRRIAGRNNSNNNFVRTKTCFVYGSKSHLIKNCHVYDTVDNFPSVVLKAASVPAAFIHAVRSIPVASRNRPASIHAGRHILAGRDDGVLLLNPQQVHPLVNKDIGIVDSGCSRSMTGNKDKLDDFVYVKGGTVTFGGGDASRLDIMFALEAYSDSDYAGSHGDRKSTTGGCQFLGRRLISWQCKKQTVVATSSTEAEYVAAASCCGQVRADDLVFAGGCTLPVGSYSFLLLDWFLLVVLLVHADEFVPTDRCTISTSRSYYWTVPAVFIAHAAVFVPAEPMVHPAESHMDDPLTAPEHGSSKPTVAAPTLSSSRHRRKHIAKKWVTPIVDVADAAMIKFDSDSDDDPLPYAPYADWEMVPSPLGFVHAYHNMTGHTKHFTTLCEILHMVEKTDLQRLLGAVDSLYQSEESNTFALLMWGDLHVLFQSLDDTNALHFCRTLERMLKHGLEVSKLLVGGELTMAEQFIGFIKVALLNAKSAT